MPRKRVTHLPQPTRRETIVTDIKHAIWILNQVRARGARLLEIHTLVRDLTRDVAKLGGDLHGI